MVTYTLFHHLYTSIEDRRTSIDVDIIRESLRYLGAHVRWVPTDRMLADGLTKDAGPPIDLLRACMKRARYQISPESTVLEQLWNEIADCWSDHRRVPSN